MSSQHTARSTTPLPARSPAQTAARLVGIVFLVIGVFGFVPGVTHSLDQFADAGMFRFSVLRNLVHLTFGVLGLVAGDRQSMARTYLLAGGITYVGLWLYVLLIDLTSEATVLPVNSPDSWLHLGLGAAMVLLGLLLRTTCREQFAPRWLE